MCASRYIPIRVARFTQEPMTNSQSHVPGFLSLVVPNFAKGQIGFDDAYLAQLTERGEWKRADVSEVIELV